MEPPAARLRVKPASALLDAGVPTDTMSGGGLASRGRSRRLFCRIPAGSDRALW